MGVEASPDLTFLQAQKPTDSISLSLGVLTHLTQYGHRQGVVGAGGQFASQRGLYFGLKGPVPTQVWETHWGCSGNISPCWALKSDSAIIIRHWLLFTDLPLPGALPGVSLLCLKKVLKGSGRVIPFCRGEN